MVKPLHIFMSVADQLAPVCTMQTLTHPNVLLSPLALPPIPPPSTCSVRQTRWPHQLSTPANDAWLYGTELEYIKRLVAFWRNE